MRPRFLLAGAALLAYGGCLWGTFHFDDYSFLENPLSEAAASHWTRPLTWLSLWANWEIGGRQPFGYLLVNLLLHTATVVALFEALRQVIPTRAALLAAGLFAIHPIQSEAVNYIFARGTLLNTLFCVIALRSWFQGRLWMAVCWFAAALLAKEECVTFPLFLLLWPQNSSSRAARLKAISAMLLLAAAAGLRTSLATRALPGSGAGFAAGLGPLEYLASQGLAIARYIRLVVVPWAFTVDPELSPDTGLKILGWLAVAGLFAVAVYRKSEGRWLLGSLILLIPSSSIFPAADLAADRRMYLPMIALAPAIGLMAMKWRASIAAAVGALLICLSIGRTVVWRSEESLWREAVERSPGKARPRLQLSRAVAPEEALRILSSTPPAPGLSAELGRVWLELNQPAQALNAFGRALAEQPNDARALNNRGVALQSLGQIKAARQDFERALKLNPCLEDARHNLGLPACR